MLNRGALALLIVLIANGAPAQSVQGTATYRERMTLPPGALFEATLEDVSRADAPALVVATTRVESPRNPPIAFTLTYDPAQIVPERRYVVRGKILLNGALMFTSDTALPVITRGSPSKVAMTLRRVQAPPAPTKPPAAAPARLEGTSWQLVRFEGGDDTVRTPDDRARYTIAFADRGRLSARIDCNRGSGTWTSSAPGQLQLGPMALTRALCPPASMHDQIVRHWSFIRSYVIKGGHLFLSLIADGGIYEFEPLLAAAK